MGYLLRIDRVHHGFDFVVVWLGSAFPILMSPAFCISQLLFFLFPLSGSRWYMVTFLYCHLYFSFVYFNKLVHKDYMVLVTFNGIQHSG